MQEHDVTPLWYKTALAQQDTLPLPIIPRPRYAQETREERYQRIKRFSELTGVRYCKAYYADEQQRRKALSKQRAFPTRVLPSLAYGD